MKWLFRILAVAFLGLMIMAFRTSNTPGATIYVSSFENVLGTSFEMKVSSVSEAQADKAEQIALDEIDRLSAILSTYDPSSEFSKWQKTNGVAVKVSPELFEVLSLFDKWGKATNGALDAAAGQAIQLWKNAEKKQQLPSPNELDNAIQVVKQPHWKLDASSQTATHLSTTPLVLNSFVKSYIINKVTRKVMELNGINAAIVNIGGDMLILGNLNENVSISNPRASAENDIPVTSLNLSGKAIATSGDYRRGFAINGKWYSHIVDPRTARPVSAIISATVVSPSAVDAGALATAFNILSVNEAHSLAATIPGTEYLIITAAGEKIESDGWKSLENKKPVAIKKTTAIADPKQKSWKTDYEVAINLELMRFEGRSRRPFVAIWVEDSKQQVVRTVALWFNKPRWLPDLKEWFHKNKDRYINGSTDVYSISSATRAAGAYTLKWDGKDDKGEYVKQDNYTIYIEVAREHGTYQLIKQDITCKNKAVQFTLPANTEVNSASIEYRKIGTENN